MTEADKRRPDAHDAAPPAHSSILDFSGTVRRLLADPRFYQLAYCVVGIMGSFIMYGVIQERIMTRTYGGGDGDGDAERFQYSAFLVLNNRMVAVLVAYVMLRRRGEQTSFIAPWYSYFTISLSNTVSTFCQYEALKYVNFPTQTLIKCAKSIPVLLLGKFVHGKSYHLTKDYLPAALISIGCTVFILGGDVGSYDDKQNSIYGLLLMGLFVTLDGFTSTYQQKMFEGYTMPTYNQMLHVNIFSGLVSLFGLITASQLQPAIEFCIRHPEVIMHSLALSVFACTGQLTIYYTIKTFGALTYSLIMTTRQFVSVILSSVIFLHPLTLLQWIASLLISGALYYKSAIDQHSGGHGHKKPAASAAPATAPPTDPAASVEDGTARKV